MSPIGRGLPRSGRRNTTEVLIRDAFVPPGAVEAEVGPRLVVPPGARARRTHRQSAAAHVVMMALATGIVATMALPAYAFSPAAPDGALPASGRTVAGIQEVAVDEAAATVLVARDAFAATPQAEIDALVAAEAAAAAAAVAAAEATAAEAARAAAASSMSTYSASYSGPSAAEYLAGPAHPGFSLASVYDVALQYRGVPYVYGGATPAGFDCSGFVMYVYAQFGISLPHSSAGQGAAGTRISVADAQPGDLVIMAGHDGFYAGNGNILHAPYEGASVRVQPIWTADYHIVRLGL